MDTTAIQFQTELNWVMFSPEGVLDGVPGSSVINAMTGKWYRKTSPIGTTTGWVEMGAGAGGLSGVTVGSGSPPVDGSILTLMYKDSLTGFKYVNLGTAAAPVWDSI